MQRFRGAVVALALLAIPLAFSPLTAESFEAPKLALLMLAAALLLSASLLTGQRLARSGPLTWVGMGVIAAASLSTALSIHWPSSLFGVADSGAGLCTIVATVVLFFAAQRLQPFGAWRSAAIASAALAAALALVQWTGHDPIAWTRVATWCEQIRPFSTLGHPSVLAGYLSMAAPLAFTGAVYGWRKGKRALALLSLCAALLALFGAVVTLSRAGWLAGALGTAVTVGVLGKELAPRHRRIALSGFAIVAATCAAVVLLLPASGLGARFRSFFESPTRTLIYSAALKTFAAHPLTGAGPDTFQLAFQAYRTPEYWKYEWGATPQRAHNDVLEVLATEGLVGALVLLAGLLFAVRALWTAWKSPSREVHLEAAGIAGCLAAGAVHGLFGFHVAPTAALAAVALGQLARFDPRTTEDGARDLQLPRAARFLGAAVLFALLVGTFVVRPLVASYFRRRAQVFAAANPPRAVASLRSAAGWMPRSDTTFALLGVGAAGAGEVEIAEEALQRAVQLSPLNAYHHANLGRFWGRQKLTLSLEARREQSAREYDEVFRLDPMNAELALDAVETALQLEDFSRARRLTESLLAAYPGSGAGWTFLGLISRAEGRHEEARAFFQNAAGADWHGDLAAERSALIRLQVALREEGYPAEANKIALQLQTLEKDRAPRLQPGCPAE